MRIAICDDQEICRRQTESAVRECLKGLDYGIDIYQNGPSALVRYEGLRDRLGSEKRGVLFDKDKTHLMMAPCAIEGHYTIPDSVTEVGRYSFEGCRFMTSVTIPASVTYIGDGAFSMCYNLNAIEIPESVTYIGRCAFWCSVGLTEIRFYGDAPVMGEDLFTRVVATAIYPGNNPTWTEEVRQNYDGEITWKADQKIIRGDLNGDGFVDNRDVEYLLWHTLFPEDFALDQDGDFEGDGSVDNRDVEYLLWHTLFPEDYPLN